MKRISLQLALCVTVALNYLGLRNTSVSEQPITTLYGPMTTNIMNAGVSSSALCGAADVAKPVPRLD